MNAHNPFDAKQDWTNPYCQNSSNDPMVDALLGNAYHVVRTVYCNLGNLKLLYDFLNQYGMVIGVNSEDELKALSTQVKYSRIYGFSRAGDRQVTDYLYVEGDRTGILPNDATATGSWITVATSGSNGGGTSSGEGAYIPWVYSNGSATGGETSINVPDGTVGVPFIIINGDMQYVGRGFEFNVDTLSVTLAQPLEEGDEVVFLLTGVPAVPDNPNVNDWVQINWLYNNGAAVGGEQVIDIPYTFQSVPAVYKNGLRLYKGLTTESYTIDADNSRIILTESLATNDRLIVQLGGEAKVLETVDRTIQEVARAADVKDSEVILSTDTTQVLNGKKVVYDVLTQHIYGLPTLPPNVYINAVSNGQLTYSPGNITVTLLGSYQQQNTRELWRRSLAEAGLTLVDGSFEDGATVNSATDAVWHIAAGQCYSWDGAFPKTVAAGSTPASTGGVGLGAWVSVGVASLKSELAKPTGAGFSGFDKSIDYETGTVGNALKKIINVNPDMYPSLQDAIDAAAALTGLEHAPSSAANHPDWLQPNTVSKVIRLNGKKYPISTTLHIHGDVSIDAGFGGVYLTDDFAADSSGYAVKCDKGTGNQYAGHISNLLIDARAKTVNGFKISDGYANKLDGIYVANVDGHGIHIAGGMGVHLLKFYAVGVLKPTNPLSTAHIVEGSDHQVSMGEGRYFRFGTWVRGGGNNRIDKVHNWGMYDDSVADQNSRMKCCFVVQNSINNSFNQCFADSPSKWDYTKANLDSVDGYINGGIGFFVDSGASGNTFSQCQTFVNMNAFNDAGLSSYTASLMPFAVGSINCSFIECENSNSPAWVARLITHIYSADQTFTNILAAKNFVGIEYDMVCNSTIFRKNVGVPVLVRNPKFETPTASYAPDFSDASYIAATVTGDVTITPAVLTNILTGYVEVLLSVYSTTSKTITFGANVKLASNTPSLTAAGTQVFRLSTTDGGTTWFCKLESAYV